MLHKSINSVLCSSNAIRHLDDKKTIRIFLFCILDAKEPHSLAFYSSTNVLFSGEQPHSLDGEVKSDKKPLSCRV